MACLETSFLIDLLRGRKEVAHLREELERNEPFLAVASPSIMELWTGAQLASLSSTEMEKINQLILSLGVLPLDTKSAKVAGELEAELLKKGKPIETEDMMIAAIALSHGQTLITRDAHYANINGLTILKY